MGVWEFIYSTIETVKNGYGSSAVSETVKPVKNACSASYGYGSAAFWKIDKAVRIDGLQKLKENMPDEIGRAQITHFASKFAQNAAHYALKEGYKEAYKLVPGGTVVGKIVSQTIHDVKSENRNNQEMGTAKEAINVESLKTCSSRDVLDLLDTKSKAVQFGNQKGISADWAANQTPEDVLRIFMMKEFIGPRLLHDLIIPQPRKGMPGQISH